MRAGVCVHMRAFDNTYRDAPLPQLRWWREERRWRRGHEATGFKPQRLVVHPES